MTLRLYTPADRDACLAIFDSNCPRYVAPVERPDFEAYLASPRGRYGVLCDESGAVIGCGGITPDKEPRRVHLTWGLIHADHHGRGLGRALTLERLRWIAEMSDVDRVIMDTSQQTVGFYEKLGFRVTRIIEDGYAPGLHRHELELKVDESLRARVFAWQWNQAVGQIHNQPATKGGSA